MQLLVGCIEDLFRRSWHGNDPVEIFTSPVVIVGTRVGQSAIEQGHGNNVLWRSLHVDHFRIVRNRTV